MLSKDLEQTLNEAFIRARERRHEFMTVEHLLLALIDNVSAADVLRSCGADLAVLVAELARALLTRHRPAHPGPPSACHPVVPHFVDEPQYLHRPP